MQSNQGCYSRNSASIGWVFWLLLVAAVIGGVLWLRS